MNKAFVPIIVVAVIALGLYLFLSNRPSEQPAEQMTTTSGSAEENAMMEDESMENDDAMMEEQEGDDAMEQSGQVYTLADVAEHATAEDCWFAVEGAVYDVTDFIASQTHPGGDAIVEGCGTDATELFNERPSDGNPHSPKARSLLEDFYIGDLEG